MIDEFKRVMSHFCTGVVVVTGRDGAEPVGMTCQSFSSLSLEPPLVMFAAARTSTTWPRIRRGGRFAVNILSRHQHATSAAFATSGGDKFADRPWRQGTLGVPLLSDAIAHVECDIHAVYPAGDHDIVTGLVRDLDEQDGTGEPLLYFRRSYRSLR